MRGGAVTLARQYMQQPGDFDLILASDMMDLGTFLALTRARTAKIPCALYMHENQVSYPHSPGRGNNAANQATQYALINFTSALAADAIWCNSEHNRGSFIDGLPGVLQNFPDYPEVDAVQTLASKSSVLPLGLELEELERHRPADRGDIPRPLILWNHRWEYDKNPAAFFDALRTLAREEIPFSLALLGEPPAQIPKEFLAAREALGERILHFGYAESRSDYLRWLWEADLLPVTSLHDFFGISVAEAIYCNTEPLLPRRLAYPELLPGETFAPYFHASEESFTDSLRDRIMSWRGAPAPALREAISRFDWSTMIETYDAHFEELVARGEC